MLLFAEGLPKSHPAIAEVKTFWTYRTKDFHKLWTDRSAIYADGRFYGGYKSSFAHSVVAQVRLVSWSSTPSSRITYSLSAMGTAALLRLQIRCMDK